MVVRHQAAIWGELCFRKIQAGYQKQQDSPLSLELKQESRQEHWSGLLCSPPGNVPDPVMELHALSPLHWQVASLPLGPPGKPVCTRFSIKINQAKIKLNFLKNSSKSKHYCLILSVLEADS